MSKIVEKGHNCLAPPPALWTFSTICDIFCLEGSPYLKLIPDNPCSMLVGDKFVLSPLLARWERMVDRGIHSGYKNSINSPMQEYHHILISGIHSHMAEKVSDTRREEEKEDMHRVNVLKK